MSPCQTMNNGEHIRWACSVFYGKLAPIHARREIIPDCQNNRIGKFACAPKFSEWNPFFSHHVAHIVSLGAKKQVLRINARRVVARVAYIRGFRWNCPATQNPCRSVRQHGFVMMRTNATVTAGVLATSPLPASVAFFNFRPESLRKGYRESVFGKQRVRVKGKFLFLNLAELCRSGKFFSHKSVVLICATLSAIHGARAFLLSKVHCFSQL